MTTHTLLLPPTFPPFAEHLTSNIDPCHNFLLPLFNESFYGFRMQAAMPKDLLFVIYARYRSYIIYVKEYSEGHVAVNNITQRF